MMYGLSAKINEEIEVGVFLTNKLTNYLKVSFTKKVDNYFS